MNIITQLVTPDPFSSRELGGVWARDYHSHAIIFQIMPTVSPPRHHNFVIKHIMVARIPCALAHAILCDLHSTGIAVVEISTA